MEVQRRCTAEQSAVGWGGAGQTLTCSEGLILYRGMVSVIHFCCTQRPSHAGPPTALVVPVCGPHRLERCDPHCQSEDLESMLAVLLMSVAKVVCMSRVYYSCLSPLHSCKHSLNCPCSLTLLDFCTSF